MEPLLCLPGAYSIQLTSCKHRLPDRQTSTGQCRVGVPGPLAPPVTVAPEQGSLRPSTSGQAGPLNQHFCLAENVVGQGTWDLQRAPFSPSQTAQIGNTPGAGTPRTAASLRSEAPLEVLRCCQTPPVTPCFSRDVGQLKRHSGGSSPPHEMDRSVEAAPGPLSGSQ